MAKLNDLDRRSAGPNFDPELPAQIKKAERELQGFSRQLKEHLAEAMRQTLSTGMRCNVVRPFEAMQMRRGLSLGMMLTPPVLVPVGSEIEIGTIGTNRIGFSIRGDFEFAYVAEDVSIEGAIEPMLP